MSDAAQFRFQPGSDPSLRLYLSLFVLLAILAMAFQGSRPLWDPDEGRYTAVALEMLHGGDWLVPKLNDHQAHLTKPPLTYWAIASSIRLFGENEWAVRLPNALAFVVTGFFVLGIGKDLVPNRPWLPVLLWATSLFPLLAANVVTTDTLLTLFETGAMYAWLMMRSQAPHRSSQYRVLMWSCLGLAFVTKGPPGLIPLIPIVGFTIRADGIRRVLQLADVWCITLFLAISFSWFAWLIAKQPNLLEYFVGYEFVDRVFSDVHDRNHQWYGPLLVYGPVLLLAAIPGVPLALMAKRRDPRSSELFPEASQYQMLLRIWIFAPLLVFSLSQSRMFLYVLPLAVPIALLASLTINKRWPSRLPRWVVWTLVFWAVGAVAFKGVTATLESSKDAQQLAEKIAHFAPNPSRILFLHVSARYGVRFYLDAPVVGKFMINAKANCPSHPGGAVFNDMACIALAVIDN